MKKSIFVLLIILPRLGFAQLNDDGKTFEKVSIKQNANVYANTIMFSGSLSDYGFLPGIKYQYCKTFGAYASLNSSFGGSDYNNTLIALGPVKSIAEKACFYLGGGIDFVRNYYKNSDEESFMEGLIEGGFIFKIQNIALDIGGGYVIEEEGFVTIGLGISF
jgi:hypothetical protein